MVENRVLKLIIKNDNVGIVRKLRLMYLAIQMDKMEITDTKVTLIK